MLMDTSCIDRQRPSVVARHRLPLYPACLHVPIVGVGAVMDA